MRKPRRRARCGGRQYASARLRVEIRRDEPARRGRAALHLRGRRGRNRPRQGRAHQRPAGVDVRELLPQYARYDGALDPRGRAGQGRHGDLYGRHSCHVAPRLRGAGVALRAVGSEGREAAPHDRGRHPPPVQVYRAGSLCQRLPRSARSRSRHALADRRDADVPRGLRAQVGDRLALLSDPPGL